MLVLSVLSNLPKGQVELRVGQVKQKTHLPTGQAIIHACSFQLAQRTSGVKSWTRKQKIHLHMRRVDLNLFFSWPSTGAITLEFYSSLTECSIDTYDVQHTPGECFIPLRGEAFWNGSFICSTPDSRPVDPRLARVPPRELPKGPPKEPPPNDVPPRELPPREPPWGPPSAPGAVPLRGAKEFRGARPETCPGACWYETKDLVQLHCLVGELPKLW